MCGVAMSEPKQPSWANPRSSRTITTTLGAPAGGTGSGAKLAVDSEIVLPILALTGLPSRPSGLERADVPTQPFGGFDRRLGPLDVDAVPDLGQTPPRHSRSGADERAGNGVVAQHLAPLRLLLEEAGKHGFVDEAITVLGVEPDLQALRREELDLVVLPPVARVPDLEVAARHPRGEPAPSRGQEPDERVGHLVEEDPAHGGGCSLGSTSTANSSPTRSSGTPCSSANFAKAIPLASASNATAIRSGGNDIGISMAAAFSFSMATTASRWARWRAANSTWNSGLRAA